MIELINYLNQYFCHITLIYSTFYHLFQLHHMFHFHLNLLNHRINLDNKKNILNIILIDINVILIYIHF